jgi:hypothetical protein
LAAVLAHQPRRELGRYALPNGELRIVGQRIGGHVAVGDIPAHEEGRVFLVERHLESSAALDGLVAAYVADSLERGEPVLVPSRGAGPARSALELRDRHVPLRPPGRRRRRS